MIKSMNQFEKFNLNGPIIIQQIQVIRPMNDKTCKKNFVAGII